MRHGSCEAACRLARGSGRKKPLVNRTAGRKPRRRGILSMECGFLHRSKVLCTLKPDQVLKKESGRIAIMNRKSTQIALGGMFSALCLILMFLTGIFPFATYVLPALAGAMLVAVVLENGRRTAVLVYVSVALLSVFIVPDREAAMLFIVFFGYYPIIKELLERIPGKPAGYLAKLALFNAAVIAGFLFLTYALGMTELLGEMNSFGKYTAQALLAGGNVLFLMYDYLLTKYTLLYRLWFKPRFLRR